MTVWWVSWTTNPSPYSRPVLPLLFIIPNLSSSSPVGLGCINHFSPFSLSIGSFPSTYKHAQISATWGEKFWLTLNFLLITRLAFLWHDCFLKEKLYSLFLFPTFHSLWSPLQFCVCHDILLQCSWKGFHLDQFYIILQNFSAGLVTARHLFLISTTHPFSFSPD